MANNLFISDAAADVALDAFAALFDSGYLRIYTTPQPTNANTALGAQTLLAELRFAATAFLGSAAGVDVADSIVQDSDANATGDAVFFRCLESNGTSVVMDGSVGTSGCDMNFNTVSIVQHAVVQVTSFTLTLPEH